MPASSAPRTGRLSCPNPLGYGRRWKCSPVNTEFIPPFLLRNGSSLGSNGEKGREERGNSESHFPRPLSLCTREIRDQKVLDHVLIMAWNVPASEFPRSK